MITTLAQLISLVESNGNPYAVRYEPAYSPRHAPAMARLAQCSEATAEKLCAMSWGRYQIMGDNLIALGVTVSPISYCNNFILQDETFNIFLDRNRIAYTLNDVITDADKREAFAHAYNGPGNFEAYAQRMLDIYAAHK